MRFALKPGYLFTEEQKIHAAKIFERLDNLTK